MVSTPAWPAKAHIFPLTFHMFDMLTLKKLLYIE